MASLHKSSETSCQGNKPVEGTAPPTHTPPRTISPQGAGVQPGSALCSQCHQQHGAVQLRMLIIFTCSDNTHTCAFMMELPEGRGRVTTQQQQRRPFLCSVTPDRKHCCPTPDDGLHGAYRCSCLYCLKRIDVTKPTFTQSGEFTDDKSLSCWSQKEQRDTHTLPLTQA